LLLPTSSHMALRCPRCGEVAVHTVSYFTFGRRTRLAVHCRCGAVKLIIRRKGGTLSLHLACPLCEHPHHTRFPLRQFFVGEIRYILCPETTLEIGCFGPEEEVRRRAAGAESDARRLLEGPNTRDYFADPEVMYNVLNYLQRLTEQGLLTCPCGQGRAEVEVYPERVELHCTHCRRSRTLPAARHDDLSVLQLNELSLLDEDDGAGKNTAGRK